MRQTADPGRRAGSRRADRRHRAAATYANGGGATGSGGAAAGIGGVDGCVDVVGVMPKMVGDPGVVGPVVLPAPPMRGPEVVEVVVVVVVVVTPLVVGSVMLILWLPHATVIAAIVTTTPAPATAATTLSFCCCNFTSGLGRDPCSVADWSER